MRYVGGKSRIARAITEQIIARVTDRGTFYEPFVGGASTFARLAPHFEQSHASDSSADVILMWQALRDGWEPPERISEAEYAELRDAEPSPLRTLAGFGGSFGGKWWAGYARGGFNADGSPRNHQGESARAVMRIRDAIAACDVTFTHCGYDEIHPQPGDTVYCDPPYASTFGYNAVGDFDNARFWQTVTAWADAGVNVFVSEYQAPDGWDCIWQAQHRRSLQGGSDRKVTTERLFTRACNLPEAA